MAEALDNFNTSIEARKLVKDPTKLFALLYSKYGDILEEYQSSLINQLIFKCSTHLNTQYQEIRYNNIFLEFLRRFYKKKEVKERIPNLYEYYKNYHLFYLKPVLRNFYYVKLLHNYQDKKAEIFYKNNYSKSSNDKTNTDDNSVTSSLSSSDHYTDYRVIFNARVKNLLEGKKGNNTSISIELSKIKKIEKNNNTENDLRIKTKILEESTLNDLMKELKTENCKFKEKENEKNENNIKETNISSKYKKKTDKKIKNNQKNSRKKNNSPKIYSKSPTFQVNHQIHIIKQSNNINSNNANNNINNNIKSNLINQQMYILSQKNSYSNKRNHSHKNKHFSPKVSYYIHNIASKFEDMFKKYPNYFNSIKQRKNKTGNNSNNNTIKKSLNLNNNIYGVNNNNFQSNFKKFSKLSASLKNSKFNITYFSQINSNNNSRNSLSAKKSNKLQKNRKIMNEINQFNIKSKKVKNKKNKTFDFNMAKGRYIELKKNYTNYNLLRFNPSYSNATKQKNTNPILFNFNILKSPKNSFGLKNSKDSNEKSGKNVKNKRFINRKNKIFKNNKKSFVSIASCSSPKFSFIMNKNEPLIKDNLNMKTNNINNNTNNLNNNNINNNNLNNNNNIDGNLYNFLNNNRNNNSKIRKNKYKKNNISYTNNNFNINFNNIFFGSSRPTSGPHGNIISDNFNTNTNLQINKNININNNYSINNINNLSNSNSISLNTKKHTTLIHQNNIINCKNGNINNYNNNISNLYIKSLNNLYNFSRNKNNKISNCSHTQTQSQSIAKNSKVIRISDSKVPANKTNSFILRCENNNKNIPEDKNVNLNHINNNINQNKCGRAKVVNQIEDLIMKTKKQVKFGSEHKNKIGAVISNKPAFNNCNNKSKNQTKNKSNYHEMFIKNLKRTSSTSIKVNTKSISGTSNNNQAINVIYKK